MEKIVLDKFLKSWYNIFWAATIIGLFPLFYWLVFKAGDYGDNSYGPDPLDGKQENDGTSNNVASAKNYNRIVECTKDEFKDLTYYSRNLWPEQLPSFEKNVNNYYDLCTEIGMNVLSFIECSLDLSEKFFRNKFENPMSLLRCNYYPPRKSSLSNKDYGIAPHTDYGCLTILLTDNNPGLEIKNPSNEWELVTPKEGEVIVNFGDMLEFWSKKKIKATPHRVYGNNKERFSIPFFFNPQYDTIISKKDKIIAGEYLSKKYDTTYIHKKI